MGQLAPWRRLAFLALLWSPAVAAACEIIAPIPDLTSGAGAAATGTDGGALSDGLSDASVDGAATDAAASENLCSDAFLYCNPFTNPATLTADFAASNLTASLSTETYRTGPSALRLDIGSAPTGTFTYAGAVGLPASHFFVRFFTRFEKPGGGLFYIGRRDYMDGVQVYVGDDTDWHINQYSHNDVYTSIIPKPNEWHCVEVELNLDNPNNRLFNAWFDKKAFSLMLVNPRLPYDILSMAVSTAHPVLWFDDLAFDESRIGCP